MVIFAVAGQASWAGHDQGAQRAQNRMAQALLFPGSPNATDRQGRTVSTLGGEMLVQNTDGQVVGRVVAVAERLGELTYILVAKEGTIGELTPIPAGAAYFDPWREVIVVDVADPELAEAPSLTPDELQKLDDPEFESLVRLLRSGG